MGAVQNLRYHLVFATKFRRKCFVGVEDDVVRAIEYAISKSSCKLERVAVEDGDHVHLVVRMSGTYSVSGLVNRLKPMSTYHLWDHCGDHLKEFYWGERHYLWSGGYYAATIGDVSADHVDKYLKKQGHWK